MLLYFFLCNILFIPSLNGLNETSPKDSNITTSLPSKHLHETGVDVNVTKVNAISEGGPIDTTQITKSPKEIPALLNLNTELSKDKSAISSNSKVVPRKGVVFDYNKTTLEHVNTTITNITVPPDDSKKSSNETTKAPQPTPPTVLLSTKVGSDNITAKENSTIELSTSKAPVVPKKPLVLSDVALQNMPNVPKDQLKIPAMYSSIKTSVDDQMPSPGIKMSTSRHPGIVMPVVITILVVPMFAVLGYMAMKRGKEAWKNRHYKRMDFLLDGMYND